MGKSGGESDDDKENGTSWSRLSLIQKVSTFGLFMCMGSGANWVFPTALAQEIPYFENHLPEKLCIATYMNATTNLGIIFMLMFIYVHYYVTPIPHYISVPALLLGSTLGCFLAAAVYPITAGGVSFMLYICCAIGGGIGSLSSVIMNPFMTSYENVYISAARSGGSVLILICAIIAFIQNPGSNNERFSTSVYLTIFGIILLPPILAYRYITSSHIGERVPDNKDNLQLGDLDKLVNESGENPMFHPSESSKSGSTIHEADDSNKKVDAFQIAAPMSRANNNSTASEHYATIPVWSNFFDKKLHQLIELCIPKKYDEEYPWLKRTIPYMMTVGWVNFNTWGIISAVTPFAIANASTSGNGSENLGIAYQIAAFALAFGDMSTAMFKLPIFYSLIAFSGLCFTVYSAAVSSQGFQNPAAGPILIIVYAVERFLEAHVVTSTYRAIATQFSPEHKQLASRAVGIADQVSTTLGTVLSTIVVAVTFNCHSSDDDGSSRRFL
jgi:multisubunit Na+/H+ antiporter MnhG subunit